MNTETLIDALLMIGALALVTGVLIAIGGAL